MKRAWKNSRREIIIILGIILMFIVFTLINSAYINPANLRDILEQAVVYGLMGFGMTYVIITGGIDLSSGANLALTGVFLGFMLEAGVPSGIAILLALLIGAAFGSFNGVLVSCMGLQPFIATLGTMQLYRGIAYIITGGFPVMDIPRIYRDLVYSEIIPGWLIRVSSIIMIVVAIILGFILRKTRFGSYLYAIGGNEEASRLSGVNIKLNKIGAYMVSGICATIAGIIMIGKLGTAEPTAAQNYEMNAIAAAAIGGTSMAGGRGTIFGTFVGAILFSGLKIGLIVVGVNSYWQFVATGVVIIIASYFEIAQSRLAERKLLKAKTQEALVDETTA